MQPSSWAFQHPPPCLSFFRRTRTWSLCKGRMADLCCLTLFQPLASKMDYAFTLPSLLFAFCSSSWCLKPAAGFSFLNGGGIFFPPVQTFDIFIWNPWLSIPWFLLQIHKAYLRTQSQYFDSWFFFYFTALLWGPSDSICPCWEEGRHREGAHGLEYKQGI